MQTVNRYMDILTRQDIQFLAVGDYQPPCVSITMPTVQVGEQTQQNAIRFRNLITRAENHLTEAHVDAATTAELLGRLRRVGEPGDGFWQLQSQGLAVYVSPDAMRVYRLPLPLAEAVMVDEHFNVTPLIPLMNNGTRFYVLAISQAAVRLVACNQYQFGTIDLPGAPASLRDTLRFDVTERQIQHHSGSYGAAVAVFHGHGAAGDEAVAKQDIHRYLNEIDQALVAYLRDARTPLVIAAVDFVGAMYQNLSAYQHVVPHRIEGNPDLLDERALHAAAWPVVAPLFEGDAASDMARWEQLYGSQSKRALVGLGDILPAAYYQRVETLFYPQGSQLWGSFDPETADIYVGDSGQPKELMNLAAVHTLLNGGELHTVDSDQPLRAILRF